jgi:hypothetical protein
MEAYNGGTCSFNLEGIPSVTERQKRLEFVTLNISSVVTRCGARSRKDEPRRSPEGVSCGRPWLKESALPHSRVGDVDRDAPRLVGREHAIPARYRGGPPGRGESAGWVGHGKHLPRLRHR